MSFIKRHRVVDKRLFYSYLKLKHRGNLRRCSSEIIFMQSDCSRSNRLSVNSRNCLQDTNLAVLRCVESVRVYNSASNGWSTVCSLARATGRLSVDNDCDKRRAFVFENVSFSVVARHLSLSPAGVAPQSCPPRYSSLHPLNTRAYSVVERCQVYTADKPSGYTEHWLTPLWRNFSHDLSIWLAY